jgi:hypothetical protein
VGKAEVLGGLADAERDLIRTRTAEGRTAEGGSARRSAASTMGRPPKLTAAQQAEARRRRAQARRSPNSRAATAWKERDFETEDVKPKHGEGYVTTAHLW